MFVVNRGLVGGVSLIDPTSPIDLNEKKVAYKAAPNKARRMVLPASADAAKTV